MSGFIFSIMLSMSAATNVQRQSPAAEPIRIGMPASDVRAVWGSPDKISRQVLHGHYIEQWFYAKRNAWVNFDGSRGEEPRVRYVFPER